MRLLHDKMKSLSGKRWGAIAALTLIAYCSWMGNEILEGAAIDKGLGPWDGYYFNASSNMNNLLRFEISMRAAYQAKTQRGEWREEEREANEWQNNVQSRWNIMHVTEGLMPELVRDPDARDATLQVGAFIGRVDRGLELLRENKDAEFQRWLKDLHATTIAAQEIGMRARQLETDQRAEYQSRLERARMRSVYSSIVFMISYLAAIGLGIAWWRSKQAKLKTDENAMRVSREAIEAKIEAAATTQQHEKSRRAFINAVAHELRTPMQSLLTAADLIDMAEQGNTGEWWDDDVRMAVARIRVAIEQLRVQLKDLTAFAKGPSESDRTLTIDAFEVQKFYDDMKASVASMADESNLNVGFELIGSKELSLVGDPRRLMQIANNLIGNAIKYTPTGSVNVILDCQVQHEHEPPKTAAISLTVKDTGAGISPQDLPHITEPFYTGANGKTKNSSGLGLAIVKNLLDRMEGKLKMESAIGVGTTAIATVHLPIKRAITTPHILVIDDELVDIFKVILTKLGCDVETTLSGEEGVVLAAQRHFDMVIVDIQLGGISGIETARKIRAMKTTGEEATPIVAITAFKDSVSEADARLFAKILEKPVDGSVLGAMVSEVLRWKRGARKS